MISGQFVHILNAYYGHIDNFGNTGTTKQLEVSDISDNNGISRARYWVKQPDGSKKYKDVEYNLERKTVIVAGSIAATTG
ncbi:Ig-like domain repeat protein, partial [Vibrio breoganii]